jgi:hypothetical protein
VYLFDAERESFAQLNDNGHGWTVRQGGPIALWDAIENTLTAWQETGRPDVSAVRLDDLLLHEVTGRLEQRGYVVLELLALRALRQSHDLGAHQTPFALADNIDATHSPATLFRR